MRELVDSAIGFPSAESVRQARFVTSSAGIEQAPTAPVSLAHAFLMWETAFTQRSRTNNAHVRRRTPAGGRASIAFALPVCILHVRGEFRSFSPPVRLKLPRTCKF